MDFSYTSINQTSTSVKLTLQTTGAAQSGTRVQEENAARNAGQDAYVPSKEAATAANNASLVEQMKSSLEASQQKLFDMVNELLSKQGMSVTLGQGSWKILSEGNFQVDKETKAAAQEAISEDGEWGVKQTSQRLVDFAKALTGGDTSMVETMRDAFIKGYEAAAKSWGGVLPDICQQTYDATMKLFDEWAGKDSDSESETESLQPETGATSVFSFEYEYSSVTTQSVSFSSGQDDAGDLEKSGLLTDISGPMKLNGTTLSSSWCMSEKVSISVTIGGTRQSRDGGRAQVESGRDGFVPRFSEDFGGYDRGGRRVSREGGMRPRPDGSRNVLLDIFKPFKLPNASGQFGSLRINGQDIPLHEDGTISVGMPDGTMRRARFNQDVLDRMVSRGLIKSEG